MYRQTASQHLRRLVRTTEPRHFSISHVRQKTVTEKVGEMAQNLNKKVGKGLASAIETGEKATEKTKGVMGDTSEQMKDKGEGLKEKGKEMENVAGREAKKLGSEAESAKKDMEHTMKK